MAKKEKKTNSEGLKSNVETEVLSGSIEDSLEAAKRESTAYNQESKLLPKFDVMGEAEVRALAKRRARRHLDRDKSGGVNNVKAVTVPSQKMGWVEVPGTIQLEWKANPWRARPKRLLALSAWMIGLCILSYFLLPDNYIMMIVTPIIIFGSASSHLIPSKYAITEEGIFWSNYLNMIFKPWTDIESCVFDDEMAELFFDTSSVRSRIQRGIPMYYGDNRDEVEALVKKLHGEAWDSLRHEVLEKRKDQAIPQKE